MNTSSQTLINPTITTTTLLVVLTVLLASCSVDDNDIGVNTGDSKFVYFIVTHGPTTDVGFWGDVFDGTLEKADELDVDVIPLHPVIESSGELLNQQMSQAVQATPPGIIGTIWGDGMAAVVEQANQLNIPVAAINVYPDPSEFGTGKAEFLLYSGQNDIIAGIDGSHALICSSIGERLNNGTCAGEDPQQVFDTLRESENIAIVCVIHQQSGGVISRCNAVRDLFVSQYNIPAEDFNIVTWDESIPGASVQAFNDFFNDNAQSVYDRFLMMASGPTTVDSYRAATINQSIRDKVVIGAFNTSASVCQALANGEIAYTSGQGQKQQGKKALDYLHYFVLNGSLPPEGMGTDGMPDANWTISPDGYRWYKTGPTIFYDQCPQ
ncbi:substrate-binding domain-containing protein [Pleionea sp. CnH1-48]|uniref:substrate-binding domain-containing protein n=1 Tax=Pleionea sp. CnH1-48 TaxID=2954494 RepID=UPI00209769A9|nr:substrate-binding domain-containing protein [Pleionea sp. CnH1-48]MCO7226996.1 substrate-binding domain-containing protein [Pleionea sp. CnH1-48]